jgi:DNA helicase-2/ATP-dependent DNA helicase PcrA
MQLIEYARAKKISLEDAAIELDVSTDLQYTRQLEADVEQYKKDTKMVEFHDMINDFIRLKKCPPVDVVFLDEAQDLSPLQWDMFFYIESQAIRSYIAGDDDQAIYNFQGADSSVFMNLKGTYDAQVQSQRVPKEIYNCAVLILPNITQRLEKQWKPKEELGKVYENIILPEIDFSSGNWMILARTNKLLKPIIEEIYQQGYRFDTKHNEILPREILNAYRVWIRLNEGASINKEDAKDLYNCLSYKLGHVEYGFSTGKSLESITSVDIDTLRMEHGLRVTGSWEQFNISDDIKTYMKDLIDSGDDLMKEPRIKISTIHGVKGQEADNVVLCLDLNKVIYKSSQINSDPEHRTFFVGVTRAKHNLFLMQPQEKHYYTIGGSIV